MKCSCKEYFPPKNGKLKYVNMPVTVDDILNKPFLFRTRDEKSRIIAQGKPRPFLKMAAVVTVKSETDGGILQTHEFNPSMYDDIQWLTGCEKRNTFFCWPCLLFKPPFELWNSAGVTDLAHLTECQRKHEESEEHISATLKFRKCAEQSGTDLVCKPLNTAVKRNREILRRLTDVICSLLMKEQSFYERKNGCQLDPDDCVEKLLFLRTYDAANCNYIEDAVSLINASPNIVHNLVNTLAKIVKLAIRKEIQSSTYVSIILSDHTKVPDKSQISTVLRYTKDGKVSEKFIGFLNMGDQKNLDQVFQHISSIVAEFEISEKLLAVSLDGGMLPANDLIQLKTMVKKVVNSEHHLGAHPLLVPWCSHNVEYVLLQSFRKIKECTVFLEAMGEMKRYFHEKALRFQSFESFILSNLPSLRNTKWFNRSQFTLVVHTYRKYFIQFFESMLQSSTMWDADDVIKAFGFQQILKEFHTVFLLQVFASLFGSISSIIHLSDRSFSKIISEKEICSRLSDERRRFDDVWLSLKTMDEGCSELLGSALKKFKSDHSIFPASKAPEYRDLYMLMIECAYQEIDIRYMDFNNLEFCELLFCNTNGKCRFTETWFHLLISVFGIHFEEARTRNELTILYANINSFPDKSVSGLLDFLTKKQLQANFKYVYKLAELILTLPVQPVSEDSDRTKLDDISDWSYVSDVLGIRTGDICLPCIEIEYLRDSKKMDSFYNDVAVVFYDSYRTLDLLLK